MKVTFLLHVPENQPGSFGNTGGFKPQPFYSADECYGAVVNGVCNGSIKPGARPKKCYGTIINGECKGTVVSGSG